MDINKEAFNQIAEGWYCVRHWPLLREELEELAQRWNHGRLLNVGCGHGPDFLPFQKSFALYGVDFSRGMLEQAVRYSAKFDFHINLIAADALSLPFSDKAFDWAIAVAVYHHIKDERERERALSELRRVLKPEGEAFLTVWNYEQPRFFSKPKEQQIPWKLKDKTVYRYYYLFSFKELRELLEKVGFEILSLTPEKASISQNFSRNICALVKRS